MSARDLFSLGGLAYWLLTGSHAYPARALGELERLWQVGDRGVRGRRWLPPAGRLAKSSRTP